MNTQTIPMPEQAAEQKWLRSYYFTRAGFSILWVGSAFAFGHAPLIAAALITVYPAWDAIANLVDASRSGGLRRNKSQALNLAVSTITTIAVAVALGRGIHAVVAVFGVWAGLSGLFQLVTGVRRWKLYGAQWAMILSGAQSALASVHFIMKASAAGPLSITIVAPYVAFGAFYFLLSAIWLLVSDIRHRGTHVVG